MNAAEQVAAAFEKVVTDVAAALFVFGVRIVGDTGSLVVELAKAVIPGGA